MAAEASPSSPPPSPSSEEVTRGEETPLPALSPLLCSELAAGMAPGVASGFSIDLEADATIFSLLLPAASGTALSFLLSASRNA